MADPHPNSRLETFCDGVFAIALTLLIIDIKVPTQGISGTRELWLALRHLGPEVGAFVLSFAIIFITWVNHHRFLGYLHKSSGAFVYANGFLLLTVVFMPFPTALAGEYLLTDHVAPAVVIYDALISLQAAAWILTASAALSGRLAKNEKCEILVRDGLRNGCFACVGYALLALVAVWLPLTVAIATTALWAYWLVFSLRTD